MKRIRTLVLYFSQVPEQQGATEQQAMPSLAPEQQNFQAPTTQSQGRTRASAAQAQNQSEEVITATTSFLQ
jgi:hypothetical protein